MDSNPQDGPHAGETPWALLGPRSRVSRSISQREMLGTLEIFASSITETLGEENCQCMPGKRLQVAIENGHRNSGFTH